MTCEHDGARCFVDLHPLTFRASYCFGPWRTGCKPIGSDLDAECRRTLEHLNTDPAKGAARLATELKRPGRTLQTGTVLTREWNGQMHQVVVKPDGFQWDGETYKSLSMVASAIAGSRWNGPRFFGFRDKPSAEARA